MQKPPRIVKNLLVSLSGRSNEHKNDGVLQSSILLKLFLRENSGFDVIIGNPPWEEATSEENAFWARYFPGLRGMRQVDQEILKKQYRKDRPDLVKLLEQEIDENELLRSALTTGPFPGMGTGDPDLYKAFCWRFWYLVHANGGRVGVVLPRSVWLTKGSEILRKQVSRLISPNDS